MTDDARNEARGTERPDDATTTDTTMPDDATTEEREASDRTERTRMRDVDHTHPYTGTPFGDQGVYDRGPEDATDGTDDDGEATPPTDDDDGGDEPVSAVERIRTDGGADDVRPNWAVHRRPDRATDR